MSSKKRNQIPFFATVLLAIGGIIVISRFLSMRPPSRTIDPTITTHTGGQVNSTNFLMLGKYGYVQINEDAGTARKTTDKNSASIFKYVLHPTITGSVLIQYGGHNLSASPEGIINFLSNSTDETASWMILDGSIKSTYNKYMSQKMNGDLLADNPERKDEEKFVIVFQ